MANNKYKVVLNSNILNKIDSIQNDIKIYINMNAGLAEAIPLSEMKDSLLISDEDCDELASIRKRLSRLHLKLHNQLKVNT